MSNNYDFLFKFIIIGDSSVGKSCILLRFTEGRYKTEHEPSLGVEFGSKNIQVGDQVIKIQIWDTAGQESFKSITRSYYKGSIAALIVYDITRRESFENLSKWLYEVKSHSHEKVEIVLIGNKSDLSSKYLQFLFRREISFEEGEAFAKKNGFEFFETSAQSGDKVEDVFRMLATRIVKKIETREINPDNETVK
jgi:Ras-related protein Rab-2A